MSNMENEKIIQINKRISKAKKEDSIDYLKLQKDSFNSIGNFKGEIGKYILDSNKKIQWLKFDQVLFDYYKYSSAHISIDVNLFINLIKMRYRQIKTFVVIDLPEFEIHSINKKLLSRCWNEIKKKRLLIYLFAG